MEHTERRTTRGASGAVIVTCALIIGLGVLGAGGCGVAPKPLPPQTLKPASTDRSTMFSPTGVRIHPLTRVAPSEKDDAWLTIEAHIEMTDAAGDGVKGAGALTLELYRGSGPVRGVGEQDQVLRWPLDLTNPAENERAYDRVTRTYRVLLTEIPRDLRGARGLSLRVRLTTPSGRQLSDEIRLSQ